MCTYSGFSPMCLYITYIESGGSGGNEEVPLTDVKAAVLNKVIEFCKHHVDSKLPEIEKVSTPIYIYT